MFTCCMVGSVSCRGFFNPLIIQVSYGAGYQIVAVFTCRCLHVSAVSILTGLRISHSGSLGQ